MRDRGKAPELYGHDMFAGDVANCYYSSASGVPCKRHPSSSPVGVCAFCLKDRLLKLVCSDCGEQRLSSCSCSEISVSSRRNSCTVDVGSVGRISFLIENEKTEQPKTEEVVMLKRSSSSCVEIKKTKGFWKIGSLFRKKQRDVLPGDRRSVADEKSEMWVVDYMGVSRSRSLCSFRGSNLYGEDAGDYLPVSAARSSISAARSSGVNLVLDSGRRSGFSEAEPRKSNFGYNSETEPRKSNFGYNSESDPRKSNFGYNSETEPRKSNFGYNSESDPRKSNFGYSSEAEPRKSGFSETEPRKSSFSYTSETEPRKSGFDCEKKKDHTSVEVDSNRRIFSLKESDFSGDSGFIDLKFDFSNARETKTEYPAAAALSAFGSMRGDDRSFGREGMLRNGSCRITVNDRGMKRSRKSFKGWGWIFKNHPNSRSARKKEDDVTFNPCYR